MRVDAHQHFWHYTRAEFGWIGDSMAAIRKDFLPEDLAPLIAQADIDSTVSVQARQTIEETRWLLNLAGRHAWIAGVVGWVPLTSSDVESTLQSLAAHPKFKGVRHVLQGEPDEYMERRDFNHGVALLRRYKLTYDLLVLERQLPAALRFVDRHPDQAIVLDHLAKPFIAAQELEPWRTNLRELARRPHVCCKLSGMVTEADFQHWSAPDLRPYFETALEAFGPDRLMFGSDWPVCTAASSYARWNATVAGFIAELGHPQRDAILGGTAIQFYRLDEPSCYEVKTS